MENLLIFMYLRNAIKRFYLCKRKIKMGIKLLKLFETLSTNCGEVFLNSFTHKKTSQEEGGLIRFTLYQSVNIRTKRNQ